MNNSISPFLRPSFWAIILLLFAWACKKSQGPVEPEGQPEEVIPGVTVGYGAEFLDRSEYEKIQLIPEPLTPAGTRTAKDPTPVPAYDFSSKMPPVRSQGPQGSCVSWAVAYAARSYYAVGKKGESYLDANGKVDEMKLSSPVFVHNQMKLEEEDCSGGIPVSSALNLLELKGVCSLQDMPYRQEDCKTKPSAAQIQAAAARKISRWGRISISKDGFRKFLYYDYPIIIAQEIDEHFDRLTDKDATGEYIINRYTGKERRGGHAMVVVGYDDNKKAFKVQNSWGSNWANKGFIWVSYDILERVVYEAYVMLADENNGVKMPVVKTTGATLSFDKLTVDFSGSITEWGDAPVTRYGVSVSSKAELPTVGYYGKGAPIESGTPFNFVINIPVHGNKLWYRAFVETLNGTIYGDTLSIVTTNEPVPEGKSKSWGLGYNFKENQRLHDRYEE